MQGLAQGEFHYLTLVFQRAKVGFKETKRQAGVYPFGINYGKNN
jgi:hypothetical protein